MHCVLAVGRHKLIGMDHSEWKQLRNSIQNNFTFLYEECKINVPTDVVDIISSYVYMAPKVGSRLPDKRREEDLVKVSNKRKPSDEEIDQRGPKRV